MSRPYPRDDQKTVSSLFAANGLIRPNFFLPPLGIFLSDRDSYIASILDRLCHRGVRDI